MTLPTLFTTKPNMVSLVQSHCSMCHFGRYTLQSLVNRKCVVESRCCIIECRFKASESHMESFVSIYYSSRIKWDNFNKEFEDCFHPPWCGSCVKAILLRSFQQIWFFRSCEFATLITEDSDPHQKWVNLGETGTTSSQRTGQPKSGSMASYFDITWVVAFVFVVHHLWYWALPAQSVSRKDHGLRGIWVPMTFPLTGVRNTFIWWHPSTSWSGNNMTTWCRVIHHCLAHGPILLYLGCSFQ